ncbi:hypothetical protein GCM10027168_21940 [Streptomyces capparidis]
MPPRPPHRTTAPAYAPGARAHPAPPRRAALTALAAALLALAPAPPAAPAPAPAVPVGGGEAHLTLGPDVAAALRRAGVVLVRASPEGRIEPLARGGVTLPVACGALTDPAAGGRPRGSLRLRGGLALVRPATGDRAVITALTADLGGQTLYGRVNRGARVPLAVTAGLTVRRAEGGALVAEAALETTAHAATALDTALGTDALGEGDVLFEWRGEAYPALPGPPPELSESRWAPGTP